MRFLKITFLALILFFLLSNAARSGTRDPNTPDEKYVTYGKDFHYVTRLMARDKTSDKPQFASAVLIKPHWALTAAHVVHNTENPVILMDDDTKKFPVSRVVIHKDFEPDKGLGFNDIALCYSDKAFGLEFYPELYTDHDEEAKICSIAGYGLNGTFHTGVSAVDTKRRAGSNKIERTERAVLICTPSAANRTALEFLICPGDSGGGLFIGNKLAGINSFVMCDPGNMPDSSYGDEAAHTRISLYADWVKLQIEIHELAIVGKLTTAADISAQESK